MERFDKAIKLCTNDTFSNELQKAFELGEKRSPKRIDFIVHPEYPWTYDLDIISKRLYKDESYSEGLSECLKEYQTRIMKLLKEYDFIVISFKGGENHRAFDYCSDRSFLSINKFDNKESRFVSMNILIQILNKIDGINKRDEYIFHGANFAECTLGFLLQIYCAYKFGIFFSEDLNEIRCNNNDAAPKNKKEFMEIYNKKSIFLSVRDTLACHRSFLFENSFKIGVQFDPNGHYFKMYEHPIMTGLYFDETIIFPHDKLCRIKDKI